MALILGAAGVCHADSDTIPVDTNGLLCGIAECDPRPFVLRLEPITEHSIEKLSSDSSRTATSILVVYKQHAIAIKDIYKKYWKQKPGFSGKMKVALTIVANGTISTCKAIHSTTDYDPFDAEILQAISAWRFTPLGKEAPSTTFIVPFIFKE